MKHILRHIYIWSAILVWVGCANGEANEQTDDSDGLISFPEEVYVRLLNECDYVDIMFFDSPISMSQSDAAGVQGTLSFITRQAATPGTDCKPMGRINYQIKGEIIADGNIYCSEGCTFIEFVVDNKPVYANELSQRGLQFFHNILLQIDRQLEQQ